MKVANPPPPKKKKEIGLNHGHTVFKDDHRLLVCVCVKVHVVLTTVQWKHRLSPYSSPWNSFFFFHTHAYVITCSYRLEVLWKLWTRFFVMCVHGWGQTHTHTHTHTLPGGGGGYSDLVPTGVCRWSRQTRHFGGKGYPLLGVFIQENDVFVYFSENI